MTGNRGWFCKFRPVTWDIGFLIANTITDHVLWSLGQWTLLIDSSQMWSYKYYRPCTYSFWPSLLKIPSFLVEFVTPIVKATHRNGKVLAFYSMPEYESWKESLGGNASGWSIKYYKDKSADVRKAAEVCISEIFRVCGPDAVTKNLKDIQEPALAIVLERLKHCGAFQETFEVAKTISMWPSLKSGSKVGKSGSKVHEPDEHPPQHIS